MEPEEPQNNKGKDPANNPTSIHPNARLNYNQQISSHPTQQTNLNNVLLQKDPLKKKAMLANMKLNKTYRYPPNINVAHCHKQANKVGKKVLNELLSGSSNSNTLKKLKICPCCDNMMVAQQFPICYQTVLKAKEEGGQKNELPIGIVMYFAFVKMVIIFLLFRLLIFDIYTTSLSVSGNYCSNLYAAHAKHLCSISFSAYNLKAASNQSQLNSIDVVSLIYVIFCIVFFYFFRRKLKIQMSLYNPFPVFEDNNFSLLIEDIPPFLHDDHTPQSMVSYRYEHLLQELLEEKVGNWLRELRNEENKGNLTYLDQDCIEGVLNQNQMNTEELAERAVAAVTMCYDLTQLENIQLLREDLQKEYKSIKKEQNEEKKEKGLLKHIPNQIKHLNAEYIRLCQHYAEDETQIVGFKLTHFTGKAFVSFEYQHYRDYFIHKYEQDPEFLKISGKPIRIGYANRPNDVYWYNMKVKDDARLTNIIYSWAVLFMLLVISFASLFGIQLWENSQQRIAVGTGFKQKAISYLILAIQSFLTFVINQILSFAMDLLSVLERHKTKSDRMKSLTIKVIVTQTINTCLIYGFLYLLDRINPLNYYGLTNKIVNLIFISSIVNILISILLPARILKWVINKIQIREDDPNINMFQIQLNQRLEYPEYYFQDAYAYYIVQTFIIAFYGYIAPFATLILIIFLFPQYWIDKYNIFRRFSCPTDFSFQFTELMVSSFELSLVFFTLSYFLWDLVIHFDATAGNRIMNIIAILLSVAYVAIFLFGTERLKNKLLLYRTKSDIFSYSDYMDFATNKFVKTFFTQNPATSCFTGMDTVLHYTASEKKGTAAKHISMNQRTVRRQSTIQRRDSIMEREQIVSEQSYQPNFMRSKDITLENQLEGLMDNLRDVQLSLQQIKKNQEELKRQLRAIEQEIKFLQGGLKQEEQKLRNMKGADAQQQQQKIRQIAARRQMLRSELADRQKILERMCIEEEKVNKVKEETTKQIEKTTQKMQQQQTKAIIKKSSRDLKPSEKNKIKQEWMQSQQRMIQKHNMQTIAEDIYVDQDFAEEQRDKNGNTFRSSTFRRI